MKDLEIPGPIELNHKMIIITRKEAKNKERIGGIHINRLHKVNENEKKLEGKKVDEF